MICNCDWKNDKNTWVKTKSKTGKMYNTKQNWNLRKFQKVKTIIEIVIF